jgi:4-hydroxybenzoate polyprenyltransferase
MSKLKSWTQFTKERFDPVFHIVMVIVFLMAHVLVARAIRPLMIDVQDIIILFIGVAAFYFKLHLYDEVRNYGLDIIVNKSRPLPRGLLTHKDMFRGMLVCIIVELICFSTQGLQSFVSIFLAIAYSLIMFKEFFIAEKLRLYLTTYAITHTIVTSFLSVAIFSFLTHSSFLQIVTDMAFLSFALATWLLFNIFEFGRKSFASSEERKNRDTYSSLFGRTGAVALVSSQAAVTFALALNLKNANHTILIWGNIFLLLILAVLSLAYILTNKPVRAQRFRTYSFVYIIAYYLILIGAHLIS